MMIAIFIVQCLILLIMFAVYGAVIERNSKKSANAPNDIENGRDIEIFRSGLQQTWTYVNVSLYKMYRELDILDFDSIQNKLQQTLDDLVKSPEKMEKWSKKYIEYVENQGSE